MGSAERPRHFSHRNSPFEDVIDELLAFSEPARSLRSERQHRLGSGHRPTLGRPLRIKMKLLRLED